MEDKMAAGTLKWHVGALGIMGETASLTHR